MIGDVIGVGSRVRINDRFGLGQSEEDQGALAFMRNLVGETNTELGRIELIGKTGTVMCIHSHQAWPYTVLLDEPMPGTDDERWVQPTNEEELDVIDDLDAQAARLLVEDHKHDQH